MWAPIIAKIIEGLTTEDPRTNGQGERAKIQIKFPKDFQHVVKWPKFLWAECDDPDFVVREWRCCTILDHLYELTISPYCTRDIYKNRSRVLMQLNHIEKELNGETWTARKDSLDKQLEEE